jgi:hypothetical protein
MASVVSIQIRVDDNDATATIGRIEQALNSAGVQGEASIKKIVPQLDQLGGHTTTSLDQIRLLSQEFGLRLPRAMEAALSRMPALTAAVGSFAGGILAIGAAEVFVRMGEAIYDAYQKYLSINAAADKYYETLKKTSELDFTNTRDLATTQERLDNATQRSVGDPKAASALQKQGLLSIFSGGAASGIGMLMGAHTVAEDGATASGQMMELSRKQIDQAHEQALAQIELNHALDDTLSKRQQISAAVTKQEQINDQNLSYGRKVQRFYGNPSPKDAGDTEAQTKLAEAQASATVKNRELDGQARLAQIKAQDAEKLKGLEGVALARQKELNSEREVTQELANQHDSDLQGVRLRELRAQYANEEAAHVREITAQTERQTAEAKSAGLTGAGRILSERDATLGSIDRAQTADTQADGLIDPKLKADYDQQRVNAEATATQKIAELESSFTDRVNAMVDQRTAATMGGYQKIEAEAQRQVAELKKTYDADFANAALSEAQKQQAAANYATAVQAIHSAAAAQQKELAAKNRADDLGFEQQAQQAERKVREQGAAGWVSAYKDAVSEIETQEQQRLAKLDENAAKEGLTEQEVAQRKVDIEREANAEIQAQNQQMQHQIAGTLQQAFTNPVEFIKSKMEQMFFEIIAGWIMRLDLFKNLFGTTLGGMQPGGASAGSSSSAGGILGGLLGIRGAASHSAPAGTAGVIQGGTMLPGYTGTASGGSAAGVGGYSGTAGSAATGGFGAGSPSSITDTIFSGANDAASMAQKLGIKMPGAVSGASGTADLSGMAASASGAASGPSGISITDMGDGSSDDASLDHEAGHDTGAADAGSGGLGAALGIAGAAAGAYSGGKGTYESFYKGGVTGAVDGTMSGLEAGAAIGSVIPGLGTVVGGAVGAAAGLVTNLTGQLMGEAGKTAARDYYRKTLFPEMESVRQGYSSGGGDYLSAISEVNKDYSEGYKYMSDHFGKQGADWVDANYLKKELTDVTTEITRNAGANGQYTGLTAKEFHDGGPISSFGSFGTSANEGFIHAMLGEGVVKQRAMASHAPAVSMMNAGADASTMAAHYLAMSGGGSRGANSMGTTHQHNWQVSAMDARSFGDFLDRGGMEQINYSANRRASLYAGDGLG